MGDLAKLPVVADPRELSGAFINRATPEIGLIRNRATGFVLSAVQGSLATFEVDLPANVAVVAPKPVKVSSYVNAKKAERTVFTLANAGHALPASWCPWIYLQDTRPDGARDVMTLSGSIVKGKVQRQQLAIVSVEVPRVGKFKRLVNMLGWEPTATLLNWPGFVELYSSSGFNTYAPGSSDFAPGGSLIAPLRGFFEDCRKYGVWIVGNLSPFNLSPALTDRYPDCGRWVKSNGEKTTFPCPIAYRRQLAPKTDVPQLAIGAEMGVTCWTFDSESGYPEDGMACCCPDCIRHFQEYLREKHPGLKYVNPKELLAQPTKYPEVFQAWQEARDMIGVEIFKLFQDTVSAKSKGRESLSPPGLGLGNYSTYGGCSGPFLNYEQLIEAGVFNFGMPVSYCEEPYLAGERILRAVRRQGTGKSIVWISRYLGVNGGWMPTPMLRPLFYEVFLNGAYGFQSFLFLGWDGFAFREQARAVQALLPVENILADGKPMADVLKPDDHTYAIGMRLRDEAVVLVQSAEKRKVRDYSVKYEGEAKVRKQPFYELTNAARASVLLPESFAGATVVDLETGVRLEHALSKTGEGVRLEVVLGHGQPLRILYLGTKRAWSRP